MAMAMAFRWAFQKLHKGTKVCMWQWFGIAVEPFVKDVTNCFPIIEKFVFIVMINRWHSWDCCDTQCWHVPMQFM